MSFIRKKTTSGTDKVGVIRREWTLAARELVMYGGTKYSDTQIANHLHMTIDQLRSIRATFLSEKNARIGIGSPPKTRDC